MEVKLNLSNTEHKDLLAYCNLNDLLISSVVKDSFTTGFNIERYGLLNSNLAQEKVVEKEVIKEKEDSVDDKVNYYNIYEYNDNLDDGRAVKDNDTENVKKDPKFLNVANELVFLYMLKSEIEEDVVKRYSRKKVIKKKSNTRNNSKKSRK
jgi:hypothetical protein